MATNAIREGTGAPAIGTRGAADAARLDPSGVAAVGLHPSDVAAALKPSGVAAGAPAASSDAVAVVPEAREAVLISLLRAHAELTRALDQQLSRAHGLSLSAYEILSRLSLAPKGSLRMSALAAETGLSVSRVSRLVDQLCDRGLLARKSCASDSRAVHAELQPAGRELVGHAQATFHAVVDERFLNRLSCDEVSTLGGLLDRLHRRGPAAA